jgi:uncharacterized protein (TIGR00297 family)
VSSHSEFARQWVHIGSGLFALLLRFMTWWQGAALAAFALLFNLLLLPRVGGRRLYRPVDEARGFPLGILLYPLVVLLLILTFPTRPDIAAAAWAVLAFGDGSATLVGQWSQAWSGRSGRSGGSFVSRPLPWNREKTIAGTLAFVAIGGTAAVAVAAWTRPVVVPPPAWAWVILAPLAAAIAAALVETLPGRLDDNISVPATAGAVLWFASVMSADAVHASSAAVVAALPWAMGVNLAFAWLGYRATTVSASGAIGGAIVGAIIYATSGPGAWTFLFITFVAASAASRLGLKRKTLLGIAEERGGRRGAGNAVANCGVAAVAAIAAVTTPHPTPALLAFVAALTAGSSDTVASEVGKAWGRSTFLVTSLRSVKPGTPGAMSLEGTAAGLVAALALAAIGAALGLAPRPAIVPIAIAATVGALVESALGATLEGPGILNNDMLNFINTAIAAAVVLAIA